MYAHILVPTDGSDITQRALTHAIGLAKAFGSRVTALAVRQSFPMSAISDMQPAPPQAFFDAQMRMAEERLAAADQVAQAEAVTLARLTIEADHPWQAIVDTARSQGCDLVVMASHGRRGVSALLLGSETQKVLTHCAVPVLVVR